ALDADNAEAHVNLARALCVQLKPEEAMVHYQMAANLFVVDSSIALEYASCLQQAGLEQEAVSVLRDVWNREPNNWAAANSLAWIRATSKDATVRRAPEAITIARRLCNDTNDGVAAFLDTYAAALAANGHFAQ